MEEDFPDNDRTKRTKFGRGNGQWRFAERTPSPEKEYETSPIGLPSPSRLPAQDRPRGQIIQSLKQQAHSTRPLSTASMVLSSSVEDLNELEVQPQVERQVESPAKDTPVERLDQTSTSVKEVTGDRNVVSSVAKDDDIENVSINTPIIPPTKDHPSEGKMEEMFREINGSTTRSESLTNETNNPDEVSQEPTQIPQASLSVPGITTSLASSLVPASDQEYDGKVNQEYDDASSEEFNSLFDYRSESGHSNAAIYSEPESDFGLDGSVFSRPPLSTEFAPPPGITKEGQEVNGLNIDDARGISSFLHSDVERIEGEAEEPSVSGDSVTESLLSEDDESGVGFDMLEGHDAAQREAYVEVSSDDRLGSPKAMEPDDEAENKLNAIELPARDGGPQEAVDTLRDESSVQWSLGISVSPPTQIEMKKSQKQILSSHHKISDGEVSLKQIDEKGPDNPREKSSQPSSQEKVEATSDAEDTVQTSQDKDPIDPTSQNVTQVIRQQGMVVDLRPTQEYSGSVPPHDHAVQNSAQNFKSETSAIEQTTVEIIDLESSDEDIDGLRNIDQKGLEISTEQNDTELAPTHTMPAHAIPVPLASDAMIERRTSIDEVSHPSTLPEYSGLVLQPAISIEESPPAEISMAPDAIAEIDEKPRLRYIAAIETKSKPIPTEELPLTVPDSIDEINSRSHLLTPSSTQRTNFMSQSSSVSLHSAPEDDTLPTPRLTQGASAEVVVPPQSSASREESTLMETPAPPKKTSALIEKLKAMRRLSSQSPKPRSSDASVLDPWFAPRRTSQVVPDSEDGSESESLPEIEAHSNVSTITSRAVPQTPEKPLAKSFVRTPSQPRHISSVQSSPQYLPPSQPPPPGFRTTLSYFVPLATLPSHFATTVDVLAIAVSSTLVTRATSGPKDYNQSLYITDPSSLALQHSIVTVQIFRPNNRCFPSMEIGEALLLRDFRVQTFQKRLLLLSTETSAWAVFRKGADVQIRGPPVEFGAEERAFARGLWGWWASLNDDKRKQLEDGVPKPKKPNDTNKSIKAKENGNKSDVSIKKEVIEGLGVDLPGSQSKEGASMKEHSLALDGVEERDMVHESIEAPKRVLRARGAKGSNGRSESARESRFGTVFTGGLGEPDETQGSTHELRDGKAYRAKGR